ncbi:MAG: ISNCY family transposase [Planctomycetaceae bacterium]|nr:ISNCY family transposase [Planctomycetaceae bacterium]
MEQDRIEMSQRERDRLRVMSPVLQGRRKQVEAARLLDLTTRQVRRIQRRLKAAGDIGIVHGLRGRASNARKSDDLRCAVLSAYRQNYPDFGPTLAAEKLAQQGLEVSVETLRQWLLAEKLWQPKRHRDKHRSRRRRRECFGELVQGDGSHHDWLEGRGEPMVLLVMIDDATSKVTARFYPSESTEGYMDLLGRYVRKHGRMVSLYTDRHSIFWGQATGKQAAQTQFTRALKELEIEWIPAYSPQAKGRVERFNGTAQNRLVKELRLAGATTMEEANAVLDKIFLPLFNRRFTVRAVSPNNAHRPLHPSMDLGAILSIQDKRKVANDYTIQFDSQVYQLLPPAHPGLRGGWVIVERRLDGTLHIRFKKHYLAYHQVGPVGQAGALPPHPRRLSHVRRPASKTTPCAAVPAQGLAVHPAVGRSGRTPAEPYPPSGAKKPTAAAPWRPDPQHPWRKFSLKGPRVKEDISIGAK